MKRAFLLATAVLFISGPALAEQKQHVSYKATNANTKYTQQLNIDAGDAPGHVVRVFDLKRDHRNESIMINGSKLVEETARGVTDIIDGNGNSVYYMVFTMDNGDKFFARMMQVSTGGPDGVNTGIAVAPITGGTGKLTAIRGLVKTSLKYSITSGFNEATTDIDYSLSE